MATSSGRPTYDHFAAVGQACSVALVQFHCKLDAFSHSHSAALHLETHLTRTCILIRSPCCFAAHVAVNGKIAFSRTLVNIHNTLQILQWCTVAGSLCAAMSMPDSSARHSMPKVFCYQLHSNAKLLSRDGRHVCAAVQHDHILVHQEAVSMAVILH